MSEFKFLDRKTLKRYKLVRVWDESGKLLDTKTMRRYTLVQVWES